GWGPVLADTARRIVADQEDGHWQVTVIDPTTGRPLAAVSTRRRPSSHQTRQVQALRPVCAFPGCRNPAQECDLDHNIPWAEGGPTHIDKLAALCPGDHTIRHHGWTYQINPDGTITWTSRLGHKYTTRPWHPP
ncbi:MAG: HNH endonuclease signature motif containing protein, partial [Acidimicrobiia bacterium]